LGTICVSKLPFVYCSASDPVEKVEQRWRRLSFVYINQLSSPSRRLHSQFTTSSQCDRADNMATVDEPTVDGPTPLGLTLHGTREYYDRWYQVLLQHDPQTQENCVYYAVFTDRMPTWFEEATLEVEWIVRALYESPLCKTCWRLHLQQEE
jgi:hypothetical protein